MRWRVCNVVINVVLTTFVASSRSGYRDRVIFENDLFAGKESRDGEDYVITLSVNIDYLSRLCTVNHFCGTSVLRLSLQGSLVVRLVVLCSSTYMLGLNSRKGLSHVRNEKG